MTAWRQLCMGVMGLAWQELGAKAWGTVQQHTIHVLQAWPPGSQPTTAGES